jgi:hypothetical protein
MTEIRESIASLLLQDPKRLAVVAERLNDRSETDVETIE